MNSTHNKTRLASGISAVAIAVALTVVTPAGAQTLSSIRGEHAAPGTTVTATNVQTGEAITAKVQADGTFVIVGVRPGTYSLQGAGEATSVIVPVGQTVTVDAAPVSKPAPGGGGAIVVTGRRDRKEVRSATVTTNVTPTQIENLPQNDRNFLNFAALAPGVNVTPAGGDKKVQAGAVPSDQINVFIDNLSLKNPVNHGGIAGQNFSLGNPFPQLAVQEFKVDTQNFKAEYEQAGSAIITAVTKTGGTSFHGDAFAEYQPKSFIGRPFFDRPGTANNQGHPCPDNPSDTCYNPKPDYKRWQFGADLGGPIIRDKLHFFFAMEGTSQTLPATTINLDPDKVPADIVSANNGSVAQTFDQRLYFGKLTAFATDNDTIDLSGFVRKEENLRDFGGPTLPSHGHDISSNGKLFELDWKHRGANWLNEFTGAYNSFTNGTPRATSGPEIILTCSPPNVDDTIPDPNPFCDVTHQDANARVATMGASDFVQNDRQKTWTIKDNVTVNHGNHVIKGGVKLSFNTLERLEDNLSNGSYVFQSLPYTGFESSIPYQARVSVVPVQPASAKDTQVGLFIQDDWTPDEHWTVNAGIRWDWESNAKNEDFVTPDNIVTALRNYEPWKAAGINPDDYISTGNNRHPFWGAFQPRLGVSYDLYGNRDTVFFAGAGRYYDRPLFIESGIETLKAYYQNVTTLHFCGAAGLPACPATPVPGTVQFDPSLLNVDQLRAVATAQGLGGDVWLLNNKTKLPYSDQFDIGVHKRFADWQTSATISHVRSHNLFQFVRGNRLADGSYPTTSVTGEYIIVDSFPPEGQLPGFNGKLNIGKNDGEARYWALYLQADKPYTRESGWGVTNSFTWQRARTNDGTELGADEFFAGPDQNQFGWEYVQGVPKYMLVSTAIVGLPYDFTVAGTLNLTSGPAFGDVGFYPDGAVFNGAGVHFPEKTFAYKTLDLRIAKTFKIGPASFTADFQVFNVFDWVNRNYSTWGAGAHPGTNPPPLLENGTVGVARTFQAGLKASF